MYTYSIKGLDKVNFEFQNPRFQIMYEKISKANNSNERVIYQLNSASEIQNEINSQLEEFGRKLLDLKDYWSNSQVEVKFKR